MADFAQTPAGDFHRGEAGATPRTGPLHRFVAKLETPGWHAAGMSFDPFSAQAIKGRGAASNPAGRFESTHHEAEDDGWQSALLDADAPRPRTRVDPERARSVITRNDSPDVGFDQALNPYRGCEHGCIYCFARPSHAYLNLSPGLDFETRIRAKTNLAETLRAELARPGYRVAPINIGSNTDPYQPAEKQHRLTRAALEVLASCHHPCTLVTKNAMVERDIDLLAPMAREGLVQVFVSVNSLDNRLAAKLEPRASAPHRRIRAITNLTAAGVPVGVLVAPLIPVINDRDMEAVLACAAEAGAVSAGYTVLRLPWQLKQLFREWLDLHAPQRAEHVMSLLRQMHHGRDYDPDFRTRMRGDGPFAAILARRFEVACRKHGYARSRSGFLETRRFVPPRKPSPQGELF